MSRNVQSILSRNLYKKLTHRSLERDWGVALDFAFPVPDTLLTPEIVPIGREDLAGRTRAMPKCREDGKYDIGHNLYDARYAREFGSLSACFGPGREIESKLRAVSESDEG